MPASSRPCGRELHHRSRRAVVDGERLDRPAVLREAVEHRTPRRHARGVAGLVHVADDRHRQRRAAARDDAPRHGRELLRLVDDRVAEDPRAVVLGVGDRRPRAPTGVSLDEHVGGDHARAARGCDVARVGHLRRRLALGAQGREPGGLVVDAEQLGRLVEDRYVAVLPRRVDRTQQQRALLGASATGPTRASRRSSLKQVGAPAAPGVHGIQQRLTSRRTSTLSRRSSRRLSRYSVMSTLRLLRELVDQLAEHVEHELAPGLVVRLAAAPRVDRSRTRRSSASA